MDELTYKLYVNRCLIHDMSYCPMLLKACSLDFVALPGDPYVGCVLAIIVNDIVEARAIALIGLKQQNTRLPSTWFFVRTAWLTIDSPL